MRRLSHETIIGQLRNGVFENEMHLQTLNAREASFISRADPFLMDGMVLDGLTSISPAAAAKLAEYRGNFLYLNGLRRLPARTAQALALFKGEELRVNGLKSLENRAAEALSTFTGDSLSLNGIQKLSDASANALSQFSGEILMWNIREITVPVARMLVHCAPKELVLLAAPSITDGALEVLVSHSGSALVLFGLRYLKKSQAIIVSHCKAKKLHLSVRSLSVDVARALSAYKGAELYFPHIASLDRDVVQELKSFRGKVRLAH